MDHLVQPIGPGLKEQATRNVEYLEEVAVDTARWGRVCACVRACVRACVCVHAHVNQIMNMSSPPLPSSPFPSPSHLRKLAAGQMSIPSRERKYTNMKGLRFNLTTHNKYARNLVCSQARKTVWNCHCVAMATLLCMYGCIPQLRQHNSATVFCFVPCLLGNQAVRWPLPRPLQDH